MKSVFSDWLNSFPRHCPLCSAIPARKPFAVNNGPLWYFHGMEEVVGSIPTKSSNIR